MKHHVVIVEGLPGTGKTTLAQWLYNYLEHHGIPATLLLEGNHQIPCDFYMTAVLQLEEYNRICKSIDYFEHELQDKIRFTRHYAYIRLDQCPYSVSTILQKWDMGNELNSNLSSEDYINCSIERLSSWKDTLLSSTQITIVDAGFLQNPINQLLFRKSDPNAIHNFIFKIFDIITPLNPVCIYLERNTVKEAISFAKKIKGDAWAIVIDHSIKSTGFHDIFEQRFQIEQSVLDHIPSIRCKIEGYDWASAKHSILTYLYDT